MAAGRPISGDSANTGHCLFSATTSLGLELTGQTESQVTLRIASTVPGFQVVSGLGQGAKGAAVALPGTSIKVASLYVDFGTYGLLFALNSPTASVDQDVQLGHALK